MKLRTSISNGVRVAIGLLAATGYVAGQLTPNSLTVTSPPVPTVQTVSAQPLLSLGAGSSQFYYWVVADFVAGSSGPSVMAQTPLFNPQGNSVVVSWGAVAGAVAYDVLRNNVPTFPGTCSACAVIQNTTNLTVTDNLAISPTAYTMSPQSSPVAATLTVNNTDYVVAQARMAVGGQNRQITTPSGTVLPVTCGAGDTFYVIGTGEYICGPNANVWALIGSGAGASNMFCSFAGGATSCSIDVSAGSVLAANYKTFNTMCYTGASTVQSSLVMTSYTYTVVGGIITTLAPAFSAAPAAGYCVANSSGGAGSGSVPGVTTQVIFNDGGSYAAASQMTWNKSTNILSVTSLNVGDGTKSGGIGMNGVTSGNAVYLVVSDATGLSVAYILPTAPGTAAQIMSDSGVATCPANMPAGAPTLCHQLVWIAQNTGTPAFSAIQAGTNTNALVLGTGGSLNVNSANLSSSGSAFINFASGGHTIPALVGLAASRPGTCSVGEMYFASDALAGQNWYYCASVNVWTPQVVGGTGTPPFSAITSGTNQNALVIGTGGSLTTTGTSVISFAVGAHTTPSLVGTTLAKPGTCTIGEMYFATDATAGQNWYYCTSLNLWTQQIIGGAGSPPFSAITSGTNTNALLVGTGGSLGSSGTATINFGVAGHTTPALVGTTGSLPVTCTLGEVYFATNVTAGQNWYFCTSSNVWSPQVSGASTITFNNVTGGVNTNALVVGSSGSLSSAGTAIINFGTGGHTTPALVGLSASKPGTCAIGEMYFATDVTAGQNWFYCTTTNAWTQQIIGGAGSPPFGNVTSGTNNNALVMGSGGSFNTSGTATVNFASSGHTTPAQVGTTAAKPVTCAVGEMYFANDATAGQNWYYCTAPSTWVQQQTGASPSFNLVTAGTNTNALGIDSGGSMTVGLNGSLNWAPQPATFATSNNSSLNLDSICGGPGGGPPACPTGSQTLGVASTEIAFTHTLALGSGVPAAGRTIGWMVAFDTGATGGSGNSTFRLRACLASQWTGGGCNGGGAVGGSLLWTSTTGAIAGTAGIIPGSYMFYVTGQGGQSATITVFNNGSARSSMISANNPSVVAIPNTAAWVIYLTWTNNSLTGNNWYAITASVPQFITAY